MTRQEEIREKINNHVASFKVGDVIIFHKSTEWDETELAGEIVRLDGRRAWVKHKYGECYAGLVTAKRNPMPMKLTAPYFDMNEPKSAEAINAWWTCDRLDWFSPQSKTKPPTPKPNSEWIKKNLSDRGCQAMGLRLAFQKYNWVCAYLPFEVQEYVSNQLDKIRAAIKNRQDIFISPERIGEVQEAVERERQNSQRNFYAGMTVLGCFKMWTDPWVIRPLQEQIAFAIQADMIDATMDNKWTKGPDLNKPYQYINEWLGVYGRIADWNPNWRTQTVTDLAHTMYNKDGTYGNWYLGPILADAMMDAGCEHEGIIDLLRNYHLILDRGMWLIDHICGYQ